MHKKIFTDLDRTLLNTDVFIGCIWHYLGKQYGVDAEAAKRHAAEYYTYRGDLYDYDFFGHLESLKIGDVSKITFELTLYLQKQFLLFNDTMEGLEIFKDLGGATILTYGNERYQQFKINCVPELAGLPYITVQQHKKNYFTQNYTEPCVLIDDKNLAGEMPDNVDFVLIDRNQVHPVEQHEGYVSIRKLQNIKEVLADEMH